MRCWFRLLCVSMLAVFPLAGCSDGTGGAGAGGMGGVGGAGGAGGTGGVSGAGGTDGAGGTGGVVASGWALSVGGPSRDRGAGLATFQDGTFVLSGRFEETMTFGAGEVNETELASAGLQDLFFARYDADGVLAWAKRAGGVETEEGGVHDVILLIEFGDFATFPPPSQLCSVKRVILHYFDQLMFDILVLVRNNFDHTSVDVLRVVFVKTMHGNDVCSCLECIQHLFVHGMPCVEVAGIWKIHDQLSINIDLCRFVMVYQEMGRNEIGAFQFERATDPDIATGPLGTRRND